MQGQLLRQLSWVQARPRVNQIADAFGIFLYRNRTSIGTRLRYLERRIGVSDRLGYVRNPAMHGFLGDTASEGRFYGLLLMMFYYGERTAAGT